MCANHHPKRPGLFRTLRPLVLASQSPRRQELLARLGLCFRVFPAEVEEPPPAPEVSPPDYALELSRLKALWVAEKCPQQAVLAADTIVVAQGEILGKPHDAAQAQEMLSLLSGKEHEVITAYTLVCDQKSLSRWVKTKVFFKELSPLEIKAYLATGEPFDKAGAYAVQGIASYMVREIRGSVTNVIGLPLYEVVEDLIKWKIIGFRGKAYEDSQ